MASYYILDASNSNSYPGSGNTWYDLSGNNYHGTLNGAPRLIITDTLILMVTTIGHRTVSSQGCFL